MWETIEGDVEDDEDDGLLFYWVMVFPNPEHEDNAEEFSKPSDPPELNVAGSVMTKAEQANKVRANIMRSLRDIGLILMKYISNDNDEIIIEIGAHQEWLELKATEMAVPCKTKLAWEYTEHSTIENGNMTHYCSWKKGQAAYVPFNVSYSNGYHGLYGLCSSVFRFKSKDAMFIIRKTIEAPIETNPLAKGQGGCDLNFALLLASGHVNSFFSLHGPTLATLANVWGNFRLIQKWPFHQQPIDDIRDYFGERIAMYFSFLGYLTESLYVQAAIGIVVFIMNTALDNEFFTIIHCLILTTWLVYFNTKWKQIETTNALKWGTVGYNLNEEPRALFEGVYDRDTDTLQHEDVTIYRAKMTSAYYISLGYTGLVGFSMVMLLGFRNFLEQKQKGAGAVANICNAIAIAAFDALYKEIGVGLTDWENHRTQSEWENAHVGKSFLFQFVNRYLALFVTAFVMPFPEVRSFLGACPCTRWDGPTAGTTLYTSGIACDEEYVYPKQVDGCVCEYRNCVAVVASLMLAIFLVELFVGNAVEILAPMVMAKIKQYQEGMDITADDEEQRDRQRQDGGYNKVNFDKREYSVAEEEVTMEVYGDVEIFEDYAELVIQLGYVCFFGMAFPFAPFFALVNNIVEIRSDAFKLCTVYRRPASRRAETIGAWYMILEIMCFVAVSSNVAYCVFFTDLFQEHGDIPMSLAGRVWLFFITEHFMFLVKGQLMLYMPTYTLETERALQKERAVMNNAAKKKHMETMERVYGGQLKETMDSYAYQEKEDDWHATKPPSYNDVKYQLNMGKAVMRSQKITYKEVEKSPVPGEESFDSRLKEQKKALSGE